MATKAQEKALKIIKEAIDTDFQGLPTKTWIGRVMVKLSVNGNVLNHLTYKKLITPCVASQGGWVFKDKLRILTD